MAVKGNKMPLTALFYNRTPRHAAAQRGERGRKISDSEGRIAEAVHQRVDVLAGLAHGAVAAVEAGVVRQAGGVVPSPDLLPRTYWYNVQPCLPPNPPFVQQL